MAIALDRRLPTPEDRRRSRWARLTALPFTGHKRIAREPVPAPDEQPGSITRGADAPAIGGAHGSGFWTDSGAVAAIPADPGEFDWRLVQKSFACAAADPDAMVGYLFARLFAANPSMRPLFPLAMSELRGAVFAELAAIVDHLGEAGAGGPELARLGRAHRKYGVADRHYAPFFAALRTAVQRFSGAEWTGDTDRAWRDFARYADALMRAAAAADTKDHPAWWTGEVVTHELRAPDIAVVTVRPDQPLPYSPGQYVPLQVPRWQRVWRSYSIANAPQPNGLIDLHVRAIPGGMVSTALVRETRVGDSLLLGAPAGTMRVPDGGRGIVCLAGGTGLAPLKAIVEQTLQHPAGRPKKITLFVGARHRKDLYDLPCLRALESAHPRLRVIPVLSEEPDFDGLTGLLPEVVRGCGLFDRDEIYICGPDAMVRSAELLFSGYAAADHIHHDPVSAQATVPHTFRHCGIHAPSSTV